ncbi:MAG TPA: glycosyltransferase family 4 protein [Thermoplasmata archaeon]|nr:glycosyltransferase family 4 protein [Thermoplasmata archaeon]
MVRLCISSQTPFIRFYLTYEDLLAKYGDLPDPLPISQLVEGEDYAFTPGGVPMMVYPLMKEMMKKGWIRDIQWVTLNPIGPPRIEVDKKIIIHSITLNPRDLGSYSKFKEDLWRAMHNLGKAPVRYSNAGAYAKYNWFCAARMLTLLPEVDLFFVHDFQQLQVGAMLGLTAPTVLRWHIPLRLENVSPSIRRFIVKSMENFDSVIVSCKRDLEGLIRAGYHGVVKQVYPYVNQRIWSAPSKRDLDEFCELTGIKEDDRVILVVARMDKIKGQDTAIKALHKLKNPKLKLVLIGNGSFSGSKVGGLAHPKSVAWRGYLEGLTKELGEEERVVFTGYLPQNLVMAAYERCDVVALPSTMEGFGLTVLEGWLYKKPVITSRGCGASELVIEDVNGYLFEPNNESELKEKIKLALKADSARLGESGFDMCKQCYIEKGTKAEHEAFEEAIERYESTQKLD